MQSLRKIKSVPESAASMAGACGFQHSSYKTVFLKLESFGRGSWDCDQVLAP